MRIKKQWIFTDSIEVEEGYTGRYGAPGMPRQKKRKATPEEIKKINQYNREKLIRRLIKENFSLYDYWATLTYEKGKRPTPQEMKKDTQRAIRKIRSEYRRNGHELKYIIRMGIGEQGGPHIHILVNRISGPDYGTDIILTKCWERGHVYFTTTYEYGGYRKLANYIAKPLEEWEPETLKRYTRSRNLTIPKPKVKKWKADRWKEAKAPDGWYIEKETFQEGINPVTGKRYRHYIMFKAEGGNKPCMRSTCT